MILCILYSKPAKYNGSIPVSNIKKSGKVSKVTGREMVEAGLDPGPLTLKPKLLINGLNYLPSKNKNSYHPLQPNRRDICE